MVDPSAPREQNKSKKNRGTMWKWGAGAAAGAALAATAVVNQRRARRAERENPPIGQFVTVDGVRLHYIERGQGEPLLLLHGNGAMIEDWEASGLLDELAATHRVIAFDRPGFGHSERPRTTLWTPSPQAALIASAMRMLGMERALVVGHSWGTLVTLALALDHPESVSGIVLISGYYFPNVRIDAALAAPPAIPVIGDIMRYTVSPLLGAAMTPQVVKTLFAPAPVPEKFGLFPTEMALRPSQIRAQAAEAGLMVPAAASLSGRYAALDLPVTIVAGSGDKLIDPTSQSERLHKAMPSSRFIPVEGSGHMVHYTATDAVAAAIRAALPSPRALGEAAAS